MQPQEEKLEQELLDDARRRAAQTQDKAQREADRLLAVLRERQEKERAARLQRAEAAAQTKARALLASVTRDVRRQWLVRCDRVIQEALEGGLRAAEQAAPEERRQALGRLLAEALQLIGAGDVVLHMRPEDLQLLGQPALEEITRGVAGAAVPRLQTDVLPEMGTGVLLVTADGRRRCDNTLAFRLRRLQEELRPRLADLLGVSSVTIADQPLEGRS